MVYDSKKESNSSWLYKVVTSYFGWQLQIPRDGLLLYYSVTISCFRAFRRQLLRRVIFSSVSRERKKKSLLNTNISLENRSRVNRRELNAIPLFGFQLWDYVLCELGCELIKCSVKVELSWFWSCKKSKSGCLHIYIYIFFFWLLLLHFSCV